MRVQHVSRERDELVLTLLDMRHCEGASVAQMQAATGLSKGQVTGLFHRHKPETLWLPCECKKPENRDGGMPYGWWRGKR